MDQHELGSKCHQVQDDLDTKEYLNIILFRALGECDVNKNQDCIDICNAGSLFTDWGMFEVFYYNFKYKKKICINSMIAFRKSLFDKSQFISQRERIEMMIDNIDISNQSNKDVKSICLIKPETCLSLKKYTNSKCAMFDKFNMYA